MAWNRSLPANSTRLRLSPTIFQANWDAIEFGQVPYDAIRLDKQGSKPTRTDINGFLYCKDAGAGFVELYYEDDRNPSLEVQITNNGGIGTPTQKLYGSQLFIGSSSVPAAFISAYASFSGSSSATISPSYGLNIQNRTRSNVGKYVINTTAVFNTANVVFCATCRESSNNPIVMDLVGSPTISGNQVSIPVEMRDRNGNHVENSFHVMIFGGI